MRISDWSSDVCSSDLDLADARYVFRWRWVDEDVALMSFPTRRSAIYEGVEDATQSRTDFEEDGSWFSLGGSDAVRHGTLYAAGTGMIGDAKRRRIKRLECQYRMPALVRISASVPPNGAIVSVWKTLV